MALQSGSKDDDNDMITEINVTPFVDVVLVLLILFMLTRLLTSRVRRCSYRRRLPPQI